MLKPIEIWQQTVNFSANPLKYIIGQYDIFHGPVIGHYNFEDHLMDLYEIFCCQSPISVN